ncbi:MAG: hypothetical protein PHF29_10620 [Candidatus Riflebacteria bacterium]|nr:hypothetical protein [Candidatus Riflebacteria bacterium]
MKDFFEIPTVYFTQLLLAVSMIGYGKLLSVYFNLSLQNLKIHVLPLFYSLLGLIGTTFAAAAINLFFPINSYVAVSIISIGILIFLYKFSELKRIFYVFHILFPLILLGTFCLSLFWGLQLGDTWGYHILATKWVVESPVPFGLANLSPRLGYNSFIFTTYAITDFMLYVLDRPLFVFFPVFISLFLCTSIYACKRLKSTKKRHFSDLFLIFSPIPFFLYTRSYGSFAPDLAAIIFVLATFYLSAIFYECKSKNDLTRSNASLNASLIFASFTFAIKLSMIFVLAVPVIMFLCRSKQNILKKRNVFLCCLILLLFTLKGYMQSGYPAFPHHALKINATWRVPIELAKSETKFIKNFAKDYSKWNDEKYINSYKWLPRWIMQFIIYDRALIVLFLFTLAAFLNTRKKSPFIFFPRKFALFKPFHAIFYVSVFGTLFCLYNAPSTRFAHGFLYSGLFALFCEIICANSDFSINEKRSYIYGKLLRVFGAISFICAVTFFCDTYLFSGHFDSFVKKLFPSTQIRSLPFVYFSFLCFLVLVSIASYVLSKKLKDDKNLSFSYVKYMFFVIIITTTSHLALEMPAILGTHNRLHFPEIKMEINSENGITTYHAPWPYNVTRFSTCRKNEKLVYKEFLGRAMFIDPREF